MTGWYVVIDRDSVDRPFAELQPYVVGPYVDKATAEDEANSDANLIYSLITIDAKAEYYTAGDVWWTDNPPETDAEHRITPPARCVECHDDIDESDPHTGYGMCASCLHNALRSGWNPGT